MTQMTFLVYGDIGGHSIDGSPFTMWPNETVDDVKRAVRNAVLQLGAAVELRDLWCAKGDGTRVPKWTEVGMIWENGEPLVLHVHERLVPSGYGGWTPEASN